MLAVTYALHLYLIEKHVVDFLLAIIEVVSLALQYRGYKQILIEVSVFQRGMGQFERKFQVEGDIAHQPPLVSEN